MGEGSPRVDRTPQTLGGEIAVVRYELDELLAELDRRRHQLFDVRAQLRRHALGVTLTAVAFATTAAAGVYLGVWRQRRRARLTARAGRLRHAIARMTEHPERVAAEPTIPGKIVAAAASAAAAALVKKLLERGVQRVLDHGDTDAEEEASEAELGRPEASLPKAA